MSIDWTKGTDKVSKYFTVHEALWLPTWNRLATEDELTDITKSNLIQVFKIMDVIREHFALPIIVHCALRPGKYNKLVGGALNSTHMFGMAVDFHIKNTSCDLVRARLLTTDMLSTLKIRMEDLPGSSWVHIDTRKPSDEARRFFKP